MLSVWQADLHRSEGNGSVAAQESLEIMIGGIDSPLDEQIGEASHHKDG
jgi:hypothetical protein